MSSRQATTGSASRTLALALLAAATLVACDLDRPASPAVAADWVAGTAAVRPSVHSLWASRPALDGARTAFAPVGTGFVVAVDSAGTAILTNAHVVADTAGTPYPRLSVLIRADTGSVLFGAEVRGLDRVRDLALLRIPDSTLTPVAWAVERVPMGTPVATIGYGLPEGGIVDTTGEQTTTRFTVVPRLTAGHASTYRTLQRGNPASNVLEVDLPLFPGVSGGPTFTRDGRVIGVNLGGWRLPEGTTAYGHIIPQLVVRQFLEAVGDTAALVRVPEVGRDR